METENTIITNKKLISIVIPVYNEEKVIKKLGNALQQLMNRNSNYDFEIILVENGSHDNSMPLLSQLHNSDPRFRILQLSRNFMADGGVAAGLRYCKGDCAVLMDADLQDPPETVDKFIKKWEKGYDVVYGIIRSREGISPIRNILNKVFYFLLNKLTQGAIPQNVTAFRLMDRQVYEVLNRMEESNRFTRGLCSWTGFSQVGLEFDRAERYAGESKSPFWDIFKEALDAIFSFSFMPLKIISVAGMFVSTFCFAFLIFQFFIYLIYGQEIPGYRTLIVTMLMMFGLLFIFLGIIGEYVARIFDEVKRRPIFVVRKEVGFK